MPRKSFYPTYYCGQIHPEHISSNCPRTIGGKKADDYVWAKVCEVLDKPDILIGGARKHVEEIRQQMAGSQAEGERLEKELETLLTERQWVITQARKHKIKESDMDSQLAALADQEMRLKQEMAACQMVNELQALEGWEEQVKEYLADLRAGLDSLNTPPQNSEEAHEQFKDKRVIVQTLVEKVNIGKDRKMETTFKLDVLAALKQLEHSNFGQRKEVEICSRRPTSHDFRLRAACV